MSKEEIIINTVPMLGSPLLPIEEELPTDGSTLITENATALLGGTVAETGESATTGTTVIVDNEEVVTSLNGINYTLTVILFLILWSYCEEKIKSGIRRFLKTDE